MVAEIKKKWLQKCLKKWLQMVYFNGYFPIISSIFKLNYFDTWKEKNTQKFVEKPKMAAFKISLRPLMSDRMYVFNVVEPYRW